VKVSELRSEQELMRAFPVVRELHRDLTEERHAELLAEIKPQGYRLGRRRDRRRRSLGPGNCHVTVKSLSRLRALQSTA
jgi:hypothetical protein